MSSPLPSILNFRDVGKTINDLVGKPILKEGRLFRSARPDEATQADRDRLIDEYGIKTIIDLRTKTEHIEQAKKRDTKLAALAASPEALPVPDSISAGPLEIPGITYRHINFNGRAYANTLLAKLTWWQYISVIALMATGYRLDAVRIIGENVMRSKGLVGLGCDSVDACTAEVREFFDVISRVEEEGPVLVHCTQGKDRTGLTVLLTLLLLGVPLEAMERDYMMSQEELVPEREERVQEIERIGLTPSFADCDSEFVRMVSEHVRAKYGGIGEYLSGVGVGKGVQEQIRGTFLA